MQQVFLDIKAGIESGTSARISAEAAKTLNEGIMKLKSKWNRTVIDLSIAIFGQGQDRGLDGLRGAVKSCLLYTSDAADEL